MCDIAMADIDAQGLVERLIPTDVAGRARVRAELRSASRNCTARGLVYGARWASELAASVDVPILQDDSKASNAARPASHTQNHDGILVPDNEEDDYLVAKSYFDLREFDRCAHHLRETQSPACTFLRYYASYLSAQRKREGEADQAEFLTAAPTQSEQEVRALKSIHTELSALESRGAVDGFHFYLHGLILRDLNLVGEARASFAEAARRTPHHWGAWAELCTLVDVRDADDGDGVDLGGEPHWMRVFYEAALALEHLRSDDAVTLYAALCEAFPRSTYLAAQCATAYYNMREFEQAEAIFSAVRERDPFRLDSLDMYSNILYVKDARPQLSSLAHSACGIDKFRSESCCIMGNYFSLIEDHAKAITCFQRALRLNRKYISAWTLMGHEYVEVKNAPAAIEAYRKAVEINPRDYRAWYGLGQTYEVMNMPFYALYYYRKASLLRPYDARMWCALAGTYEALDRKSDAIECYKRAEDSGDRDGIAIGKLAILSEEMGDVDAAATYHALVLDRCEEDRVETREAVAACMFLGKHHSDAGAYDDAEQFYSKVLNYNGVIPEIEEARAMLRAIRNIRQRNSRH